MKKTISVSYRDTRVNELFNLPNECPHCGKTMAPETYNGYSNDGHQDITRNVGILVQCTFEDCKKYYATEFKYTNPDWRVVKPTYSPNVKIDLPEDIEKISKNFVEIFTQAAIAEAKNLNQIAGVGYRKAAEFLIKDYAIRNNPKEEKDIKKTPLGKVITNHLNGFPKIQRLSTAIAWIGNDETHYVRRHDDKDINDLKRFIKASAQFIAADYDADEALEFTSDSDS